MTRPDIWPVHVINMADNALRLSKCSAYLQAQSIPFQRFAAVNGHALGEARINQAYDPVANRKKFRHPLLPGEIGCYLSHLDLWREIAAAKTPGAIILEDDFAAANDLAAVLAAISADNGDWDMIKLFSRRPGSKMLQSRRLCPGYDLAQPYQIPNTTLGYAIRRDAARRLLQGALPFARPIDEDHKRFWEHGLAVWMVQPPPLSFAAEASRGDTIQSARKSVKIPAFGARIRQAGTNLKYRLTYLSRLHFNRLTKSDAKDKR